MSSKINENLNKGNNVVEPVYEFDFDVELLMEWDMTIEEAISEIRKISLPEFPLTFKEKSWIFKDMKDNDLDKDNFSEEKIEYYISTISNNRDFDARDDLHDLQRKRYLAEFIRLLSKYDNLYDDMKGKSLNELKKMWLNGDFEGRIPYFSGENDVECAECIAQAHAYFGDYIPEYEVAHVFF